MPGISRRRRQRWDISSTLGKGWSLVDLDGELVVHRTRESLVGRYDVSGTTNRVVVGANPVQNQSSTD